MRITQFARVALFIGTVIGCTPGLRAQNQIRLYYLEGGLAPIQARAFWTPPPGSSAINTVGVSGYTAAFTRFDGTAIPCSVLFRVPCSSFDYKMLAGLPNLPQADTELRSETTCSECDSLSHAVSIAFHAARGNGSNAMTELIPHPDIQILGWNCPGNAEQNERYIYSAASMSGRVDRVVTNGIRRVEAEVFLVDTTLNCTSGIGGTPAQIPDAYVAFVEGASFNSLKAAVATYRAGAPNYWSGFSQIVRTEPDFYATYLSLSPIVTGDQFHFMGSYTFLPSELDLNGDSMVDCADLFWFRRQLTLGLPGIPSGSATRARLDLSGNGVNNTPNVETDDLRVLAAIFSQFGFCRMGDISNNGVVDWCDVALLRNLIAAGPTNDSSPSYQIRADVDLNGVIDGADEALLISRNPPRRVGDANSDGAVDFADTTSVLTNFGSSPGPWGPGDADGNGDIVAIHVAE